MWDLTGEYCAHCHVPPTDLDQINSIEQTCSQLIASSDDQFEVSLGMGTNRWSVMMVKWN